MEVEPTCVTLITLIILQSMANIQHCSGVSNEVLTNYGSISNKSEEITG